MSLESYRASMEQAHLCVETGNVAVGLWVLASVHDRLADELDAQRDKSYLDRVYRAMLLAPTPGIDICAALLNGETVPLDRLDADAVRRFGLRAGE